MKPLPKYLSRKPLIRSGSTLRLTKREMLALAKKKGKANPPEAKS